MVVAGMEGALPSVVAGLVAVPVIIFFVIVQGRMAQGLVGGAVKG